ncbi:hypothetical protein L1277_001139 [Okibacterium sp. HSC-33S16]|uniref:hypothetical protein n=1 Tax=Okibacterium sp. HSC-33S16 TaxID=2910965 RepID=UPI00209F926E|nr:hypothetical protein [Okibacterium sp. HSC-33S16]MCP2031048.1 hypothetical protein [Okibacterium sp. HSC-33S16]
MLRRIVPLVALPFFVVLAGCSAVGDAASDIAGQAASSAGEAAARELQNQICTTIDDGRVSDQDRDVLVGLLSAAEAAGIATDILTPLTTITGGGDQVPSEAVNDLFEACGVGATPAPN